MAEIDVHPKKRKLSTVGDTDIEDRDAGVEGHAVVHLDASTLHRIKQEPADNDEYHQPKCVHFQRQMKQDPVKKIENRLTADNQGTVEATDPPLNEESLHKDYQGNLNQEISIQEKPAVLSRTNLRGSARQRFPEKRLSVEHKQTESDSLQQRKVTARMHPSNSPRNAPSVVTRQTRQTFSNTSFVQDASKGMDTNVVLGDSNEVFRRRFRKMLKELVAKRMLKLQHSAVYSETMTALQRKIANLERRNRELAEKATRLETSIINLSSERENNKAETVSRGTQVSMGMILSRAWRTSGCADKPASVPTGEQTSLPSFTDGPVIVNVFGNEGNNGPSVIQPPYISANVSRDKPEKTSSPSIVSQGPQANFSYPKIQLVSSVNSSKTGPFTQHTLVTTCETYTPPEHRFLGHRSYNRPTSYVTTTRVLEPPNMRMPMPEVSPHLLSSSQVSQAESQHGHVPGYTPTRMQQSNAESVHRIAAVRPQQVNTSLRTTVSSATQQVAQVTHYPHQQPALSSGPLQRSNEVHAISQFATGEKQNEEVQCREQCPAAAEHQDNRPKDSDTLAMSNLPTNNVPPRYHKRGLNELAADMRNNVKRFNYISSWGETASGLGESSSDSVSQRTDHEAAINSCRRPPPSPCCNVNAKRRSTDLVSSRGQQEKCCESNGNVVASAYANTSGDIDQGFTSHTQPSFLSSAQQQRLPAAQRPSDNLQLYRLRPGDENSPRDPKAQQSLNGSGALTGVATSGQLSSRQTENNITFLAAQNTQYRQPFQLPTPNESSLLQPNQVKMHTYSTPGDTLISRQFSARQEEYARLSGQNIRPQMDVFWYSRFNQRQPYNGPNEQIVPFASNGLFRGYHQHHHSQQRKHLLLQQQQQHWQQQNQQLQWQHVQHPQLQQQQQQQQNQQLQKQQQQQQQLIVQQLQQQQQCQRQQQKQQLQQHQEQQLQQYQRQQQQLEPMQQHKQQQQQIRVPQPQLQYQGQQQQQHQPQQQHKQQQQQQQQRRELQQQQQIQQQQHQQYQQQQQHQPQQQLPPWLVHYQQRAVCLQPPTAPNQAIPPGTYPPSHQQMMPHWHSSPQTGTPSALEGLLKNARDGSQSQNNETQNIIPRREMYAVHQQVNCSEGGASEALSSGSQSLRAAASQTGHENVDLSPLTESARTSTMTTTRVDISCNSSTISTLDTVYKSSGGEAMGPLSPSFDKSNKEPSRNGTTSLDGESLTPPKSQEHETPSTSMLSSEESVLRCEDVTAPSVKPTLGKAQRSSARSDNKTYPTKYPVCSTASQTSPSQPKEENKPSKKTSTNGNSATDSVTEVEDGSVETNSLLALNGDGSDSCSPDDRLQAGSETTNQPSAQDDDASQLEMNEAPLPLKPVLTVEEGNKGIVLLWDLPNRGDESKVTKYELFVMTVPTEANPSKNWDLLGALDALALPMACTMNQFIPGASYYFTVRAVTKDCQCGLFSDPCLVTIKELE